MLWRIVLTGMVFFLFLGALWQYMFHIEISSVRDMINPQNLGVFFTDVFSLNKKALHLTGEEMGIYFSVFVLMQFWNLFNVKYFRTDRCLIGDIIDLFRDRERVKESYNKYFLLIAFVIIVGQVLIVTFAGDIFNVKPITAEDWMLLIAITSPVLIVPDIVRFVSGIVKR
jgi:Ca2+-transporting ATPase